MADPDLRPLPPTIPPAAPARRGPFSRSGLVELLFLVAVAIGAAAYAVAHLTAHEEVRIDAPTGPLAHLDEPSLSATPEADPAPAAKADDAPVRIQPAANP
jgi:hypothetical protein